ncbi:MAG: GNAT family N-acetyltransferase [Gemmatimonadota bacterium]|nr:MAG: GNAT family N-acetyltransferase [Gemmatimonadota bacterium]
MKHPESVVPTPWDAKIFGMDTYEILSLDEATLQSISSLHGHFTIKVDPLLSTELLHRYDFYYCDTQIDPFCLEEDFVAYNSDSVSVLHDIDIEELVKLSQGAYSHGRFHRDFNIRNELADLRYDSWLGQLHQTGRVIGLAYKNALAAYFACENSKVLLHAIDRKLQGKGLAKYLWTAGYRELFNAGHREVSSCISVANMPVLNLYRALGFKFRNPVDVYHKFNPPK